MPGDWVEPAVRPVVMLPPLVTVTVLPLAPAPPEPPKANAPPDLPPLPPPPPIDCARMPTELEPEVKSAPALDTLTAPPVDVPEPLPPRATKPAELPAVAAAAADRLRFDRVGRDSLAS